MVACNLPGDSRCNALDPRLKACVGFAENGADSQVFRNSSYGSGFCTRFSGGAYEDALAPSFLLDHAAGIVVGPHLGTAAAIWWHLAHRSARGFDVFQC